MMAKTRFKIGDVVRCKKKYSSIYSHTNMLGLFKVVGYLANPEKFYGYKQGWSKSYHSNMIVEVVAHKTELKGSRYKVYDFHYRRANKADEQSFLLISL